ncbi:MAG: acyl-CoA dehydrogenase [Syntrophales bacterium]
MKEELVDVRDVRFILYDILSIEDLCRSEKFKDHSKGTFEMVISTAEKLATNAFAPVNSDGDSVGCKWRDGIVQVPSSFYEPFRKYCEGGWISVSEDYDAGGQNLPLTIQHVCHELFFSANHSLAGYMGLTHSAAKVIEVYGTPEQKRKYMTHLYSGRFSGGMNLTEPQAGSDVGAIKVKAVKKTDGTYSIQGSKIFITGGDHDLTENIIHIVLARIEGDPEGTKGLTCFVVPKMKVREDGTVGESNNITCAGIEAKMGMKGSATCVLNYGENGECIGELLGPERNGIRVMFHMMNEQRLLVGLQGLAQGSTAYLHALQFAKERLQGAAFGSKSTKQAAIIEHPDVLNNLMIMKAQTEGMRALILFTVHCIDEISASEDDAKKRELQDIVELLTPICKAYCTEKGFDVCVRAMQVYGGYGYCKEYHVEQFARDCKITSIYEGTNGIQAIDLLGRKIRMKNGGLFQAIMSRMKNTAREADALDSLSSYAKDFILLLGSFEELTDSILHKGEADDFYLKFSQASAYLDAFGDILLGWIFLWQAIVAERNLLDTGSASHASLFYKEKFLTARFYLGTILPVVRGKMGAIRNNERSLLEIRHSTFLA